MNDTKVKVSLNIPEKATKQLAFKRFCENTKRKLVISTNWLNLFDFHSGDRVVERSLGNGKGIVVERVYDMFDAPMRTKKVYERSYARRKNNPVESMLDISGQKLIDESFPEDCEKVHITFTTGKIFIAPITTKQAKAIRNARNAKDKLSAFAACTAGVDLHSLVKNEFSVHSCLEWRPPEKRDKTDLSETGAMSVLANIPGIRNFYNEDIYEIDFQRIAEDIKNNPYTLLQISLQCDEYSSTKTKKMKAEHVEDLSTTVDMALDLLHLVDATNPPCILIENVRGFVKSPVFEIMNLRLRRYGYTPHIFVEDARDYGGLTSRTRAYCFYTALPADMFFEEPTRRRETPIWPLIEPFLGECRDVSGSKSLQRGRETGRLRVVSEKSTYSNTFLKSQSRCAADSVVIETRDGRLLWPSESLMKFLMGIDEDFNLSPNNSEIASEIIGQSIDVPMHESVIRSVRRHIEKFFSMDKPSYS